MRTLLLAFLTFFIFSFTTMAQEASIQELETQQIDLQEKIKTLKDSLQEVKLRLASLKQAQSGNEIPLGPNEILLTKQVSLKQSTLPSSDILLVLEPGTRVLKVDEIGKYYLICFRGTCGYLESRDLNSTTENSAG